MLRPRPRKEQSCKIKTKYQNIRPRQDQDQSHFVAKPQSLVRRSADISRVVAPRTRVVFNRRVFSLVAAAWYREPGRRRLTLVDGRFHDAVRRRTGRSRLHVVIGKTAELRPTSQTPRRIRLAYLIPGQSRQT